MKTIYLALPFFLLIIGCQCEPTKSGDQPPILSSEKLQLLQLQNRDDSSTWDSAMFQSDLELKSFYPKDLPISMGVFPTPRYDILGPSSFKGIGMMGLSGGGDELRVAGKPILYSAFYINQSETAKAFVGTKKDRVFFQILVLTDSIDTVNYTHLHKLIVSRNHPDYIGEGFFQTRQNKIDYLAFHTVTQSSYAVVNLRTFDLSKGRTLLIAPMKDGSLRSLQIASPPLSSDELDAYTKELLDNQKVKTFFTAVGTI